MRRERLQAIRKPILCLYIVSFVLPIGGMPAFGVYLCIVSLVEGLQHPSLFVIWSANPLLWFGLASLSHRRDGRAAAFGLASFLASLPSILYIGRGFAEAYATIGLRVLAAWMGSIAAFALVGGLANAIDEDGRYHPQIHLGWVIAGIAVLAVLIGFLAPSIRTMGWSIFSPNWIGTPRG